nr:PREDICTED: uncharacterized protein LOC105352885 isoform X2 [Fragaria vesca subsp. vesca]
MIFNLIRNLYFNYLHDISLKLSFLIIQQTCRFCQPGDNLRILANPHPQITAKEVEQKTKITVHELNKLNPQHYKDQMIYCKGSISRFSPNEDWWYEACPHCYKQLKLTENSDLRICQEHNMQVPLPCYRMHVVIEDPNNEALLKLRGKPAEQLFGITCKELINKYHYTTQESLPQEILQTIGQIYIFQIQITEKHELIIKGIFPDKQSSAQQTQYETTTSTPAQTLHDKKRFSDKNKRELFSNDPKKIPQ